MRGTPERTARDRRGGKGGPELMWPPQICRGRARWTLFMPESALIVLLLPEFNVNLHIKGQMKRRAP